jgi:predicted Zn-dependent protease
MKYQPSLPEHNDNVSHDRPLREFFLLLSGLVAGALVAFWMMGLLVDFAVDHLSAEAEARLNRAVSIKWEQEKPFSAEKLSMLQTMASDLKQCAGLQYPVEVHLADSELVNAAAFPGGHILVFSGLLDRIESENALSFVLAHEFSHLKNRDHLRAMGRSLLLVGLSALLTGSHSDLTQVLIPVRQIGIAQHSQDREMAADRQALQVLNCRYGHAGGATDFFEMLQREAKDTDADLTHYFSSHPQLQARIDNLHRLIREMQLTEEPVRRLDTSG